MQQESSKWESRFLMMRALQLASLAEGRTYPNPAVGAVVVKDGEIVGQGYHHCWGSPHAEIGALRQAGPRAEGADLYVTLEPCCHQGVTAPCTDAILRSGIRRVYVPSRDPYRKVRGRGIRRLREAGVEVNVGLLAKRAKRLNEAYFKYVREGLPFVTLKVAQTLDGKIATSSGRSKWITSPASRALVRDMRFKSQAVLVGINTVMADNPTLLSKPRRKRSYYRCVLDANLRLPLQSFVTRTAHNFNTVVFCNRAEEKRRRELERCGVTVVQFGGKSRRHVDIQAVMEWLGAEKVQSLLVEGGSRVFTSFLRSDLVDKMVVFTAPYVMGGERSISPFLDLGTDTVRGRSFEIDHTLRVSRDLAVFLYPGRRA